MDLQRPSRWALLGRTPARRVASVVTNFFVPAGRTVQASRDTGVSTELQLEPHQQIKGIIEAWPSLLARFLFAEDAARSSSNFDIAFRRRAFLSVAAERRIRDEVAIKLLCEEAMQRVQVGQYPCNDDDVAFLASLRCQLAFGDYNPEVRRCDGLRPPRCRPVALTTAHGARAPWIVVVRAGSPRRLHYPNHE